MQELVISAVGPDQPGLVDRLTETLVAYQANVADSRMVNLRGQFAIVMLVSVPDQQVEPLRAQLPQRADQIGLMVMIAPTRPGGSSAGVPYRIRTYAMDQVGLVHRITHALSSRNVNIEDMTTKLEHGPHTGTPLFSMDMIVTVPSSLPLKQLRDELERLCAELNCDLDIDRA